MDAIIFAGNDAAAAIKQAETLGYDGIILLSSSGSANPPEVSSQLPLRHAIDCKGPRDVKNKAFTLHFQLGTRGMEFIPGVSHVYANEYEAEKDFMHQRRSGLNHVLLRTAAKNDVVVVLELGGLRGQSIKRQQQLIGRMIQNVKLCRKAGVSVLAATMAKNVGELAAQADVEAFFRLLQ